MNAETRFMFAGTASSIAGMTEMTLSELSHTPDTIKPQTVERLPSPALDMTFVNPLLKNEWDRLVVSHPNFNFFHSAAWAKVLCKTYGHQPLYLRFARSGKVVALIPIMEVRSSLTGRRGVGLPFSDFCAPLLFDECDSGFVMEKLSELALERKWKYLEVRGGKPLQSSAISSVAFHGHTLVLHGGAEKLLAGFTSSVRRALRKAEQSDMRVKVAQSRETIMEFYRLHVQTRRRHGVPPQSLSFFLNIYEEIIKQDLGFVILAERESRPVAAAVFFHMGKKAVYKFGASNEAFQEFRGNNLVMWEGIRFLAQNGFETLHFGRTSLENAGLRRFKLAWGTVEEKIQYFRFDTMAGAWVTAQDRVSGLHNAVFSRLPLALNRMAGKIIYPHLD
jgi:Acetyltransferase (GNAT) domain